MKKEKTVPIACPPKDFATSLYLLARKKDFQFSNGEDLPAKYKTMNAFMVSCIEKVKGVRVFSFAQTADCEHVISFSVNEMEPRDVLRRIHVKKCCGESENKGCVDIPISQSTFRTFEECWLFCRNLDLLL